MVRETGANVARASDGAMTILFYADAHLRRASDVRRSVTK